MIKIINKQFEENINDMFLEDRTKIHDIEEKVKILEKVQEQSQERTKEILSKIELLNATKPSVLTAEEEKRIIGLETKMLQLWGILTEENPRTHQVKPTRLGRQIRGRFNR